MGSREPRFLKVDRLVPENQMMVMIPVTTGKVEVT
jgi:hypothetical protein